MLQKFIFIPYTGVEKMSSDFHAEEGCVCGANVKKIETSEKTIKRRNGMRFQRVTTTWGVFIHIRMDNGDQYDAVWKIGKTFTEGLCDVPMTKKLKKKSRNITAVDVIPTVLRAIGVSEWVDMIGTKVRVKPIDGIHPAENGFGVSPINEEKGRWFYPDLYEIHTDHEEEE